ncbi:acetyl-CoA carboxylase carboxyltransferase subunit alpha [Clostridium sp. DSM 8431]|uniref:acetyl-CoA carboxylase carboxyltransferase subunit alpha n=1 Tax=Clostridium sp. DSM 8431 TaxID=1761781 RepID=UPI0008E60687|nr:acetyl-CoA carboxylase carboxyltransferase subunit alpha [Clostridium sp. DSM 8431]SFU59372.1 acetyl-CoA carboxylase carboxyltransferase subunit alpha [Clostridium sp. DSM 8431]
MNRELIVKTKAWDKVNLARNKERPIGKYYIDNIFDNFIELHGDRAYGDDKAIVGGIAFLNGQPVTVIAICKGNNTKENIERNFGMPKPEGYRKALRLMKEAEKFKRPIICFVDTPGAFCGVSAEERGMGEAIAKNLFTMSRLETPIVSVLMGEGGSGGALALAVADRVLMLENSIYSILSPEGFASILWKDGSKAKEAAEVMKITSLDLKELKVIDRIIKEPFGGAHKNPSKMCKTLKKVLIEEVSNLSKIDKEEMLKLRYNKFRNMGIV